jgi:hypothetical protein
LEEALRANPVASNYGEPEILDSWTKGDRNYYVIYAGEIRNTFVSEIAYVHYIGFPIGFSKTTVTEKAVTNSMTKTVSNSIVFSNTSQTKSTLDAAIKAKFKIVDFSVGLKLEESMTNSVSNTKSTETSISSVTSTVETEASTISFEIGNHGETVGHYRYSLYDVSDVYFFISTSLDNDALLSWDVISCARGSYLRHWEYSPSGNFDNSPVTGSEIVFAEDFYKALKKPTTDKTVEKNTVKFTTAGNHTYALDKGFPATVEIYALGAGGGGQGGHSKDRGVAGLFESRPNGVFNGTGGAGGGGAAAYIKFTVTEPSEFSITVGQGGTSGNGNYSSYTSNWESGGRGGDGSSTSISWNGLSFIVEGGKGGGGNVTNGGNGGINIIWPSITYEDMFSANGTGGTSGNGIDDQNGNMTSNGGNGASIINRGSLASFIGGSGGKRPNSGNPEHAGSGGGGYAGYSQSQSGDRGGNGHVIIVVSQ